MRNAVRIPENIRDDDVVQRSSQTGRCGENSLRNCNSLRWILLLLNDTVHGYIVFASASETALH